MNASIVRILVDPYAGEEAEVYQALVTRLNSLESDTITPLYLRWIVSSYDLELVCHLADLGDFNDFMIETVRSVTGVNNTESQLLNNGFVFPGGFALSRMRAEHGYSVSHAVVDIDVIPGDERAVFASLYDLPEADDLRKVYLFQEFAGMSADVTLQIAGPSASTIATYVAQYIRPMIGIRDTVTTFTSGTATFVSGEELETLLAAYRPA